MSNRNFDRVDASEGFSDADRKYWEEREMEDAAFEQYAEEQFLRDNPGYYDEDDGQPTEYEEWQDLYGGDDWDHGQYDDC